MGKFDLIPMANLITGGPNHNFTFTLMSRRGGSTAKYPWKTTNVGYWFFKEVSFEDWVNDRGRPGFPKTLKDSGMEWMTERVRLEETGKYGYRCTRVK